MYDDAGRSETWIHNHHLLHARMLPYTAKNARRVSYFDQAVIHYLYDSTRARRLMVSVYLNIIRILDICGIVSRASVHSKKREKSFLLKSSNNPIPIRFNSTDDFNLSQHNTYVCLMYVE